MRVPDTHFRRKASSTAVQAVLAATKDLQDTLRAAREDYMVVRAVWLDLAATMLKSLREMKLGLDADRDVAEQLEAVFKEYLADANDSIGTRLRAPKRPRVEEEDEDEEEGDPSSDGRSSGGLALSSIALVASALC